MNQLPAAPHAAPPRGNNANFWWIAAGVTVILALFLSPLASQAPDGLEAAQQTLRLQETTSDTSTPGTHRAPLPDYKLAAVASPYWSTGLAGLIGAAGVFLITTGLVRLVARKTPPAAAQPTVMPATRPSTGSTRPTGPTGPRHNLP